MNRGIKTVATSAFCCLVALTGCNKQQQAMDMGSYKTLTVKTDSRELQSRYSASIQGRQDVDIYPQVSGTLQQLCVKEGDRVTKGQTLFIIDQVPYQAALNTAKANLEAAKAAQATAELTYKSTQRLFDQKVVSDFDLQTAQNNLMSAKAAVAQMEAQVVNAANNLSYTVVKSPSNGVVGELPYRQGALVSSAIPQPLTTVSDNSELYVYFSINENELINLVRQYGSLEEAVKKMIENSGETGIEYELDYHSEANFTDYDAPIVRMVHKNAEAIWGRTVLPAYQWASSDAREYREMGIPTIQYGPSNTVGIHSYNETVDIEDVKNAGQIYILSLCDLMGIK